ncbi:heme-binding domain-containing protein [Dokdonia sp.]|uniref:heme-binding domain-containing protein n=1 Tax=Dokdonia sp. TaxID=2024995 RepID=UPI00326342C3
MKLKYKIIVLILLMLVCIQFYRPNKNVQKGATISDILISKNAPAEISKLYTNACYDCHSNYTNYEWFDNIAPVSWFIDANIEKGVSVLNFSNWKNISIIEKEILFSAISFNIDSDKMPKKNYTMFHPKSELSEEDKAKMIEWIIQVKKRFLEEHGQL